MGLTNIIGQTTITTTARIFDIAGYITDTARTLTSNAARGQAKVVMSSGDGATFAVGDYVMLRSAKIWAAGVTSATAMQGEIHRIMSIASGTISLDSVLHDTYNTADTAVLVKVPMLRNIVLEGFSIKPAAGYTATGAFLRLAYIDNLIVRDVEVQDAKGQYSTSFSIIGCINSAFENICPTQTPSNTFNDQYGIHLGGACQSVKVNLNARGIFRHSFTLGGISGANFAGIVRDVNVSGSAGVTGETSWDTHADGEGIVFNGCNSYGQKEPAPASGDDRRAMSHRAAKVIITNCVFQDCIGYGITLDELSDNTIISNCQFRNLRNTTNGTAGYAIRPDPGIEGLIINGNMFEDINGVWSISLPGSNHDTVISNNVFKNAKLVRGTDSLDVVVTGNRCNNGPTQRFISMSGTSDYWLITGNNCRNSAASTTVGTNNVIVNNIAF